MPDYYLAWWNLENLFDEENSPRRTEKVARVIANAGWPDRSGASCQVIDVGRLRALIGSCASGRPCSSEGQPLWMAPA